MFVGIVLCGGYEQASIFIPIDTGDGMNEVLTRLGLNEINGGAWAGAQIAIADSNAEVIESVNPSTGRVLAKV